LDQWRATKPNQEAFSQCDLCHFSYVIEPLQNDDVQSRMCRIKALVARDVCGLIILWQAVVALLGLIVFAADSSSRLLQLFPQAMSAVGVYYLCGLITFLAILGLVGLCGYCCDCVGSRSQPCDGPICCYCYGPVNCNCGNCGGGNCDCKGDAGAVVLVILLVVVIILAIFGIFFGIDIGTMLVQKIYQKHSRIMWLREETKRYVVKDLSNVDLDAMALANHGYVALYPAPQMYPQPMPAPAWVYGKSGSPVPSAPPMSSMCAP